MTRTTPNELSGWTRHGAWVHALAWTFASLLYWLNQTQVTGRPRDGPCIYAVNHVSFTDVYLVGRVLVRIRQPLYYVAKRELASAPVFGWLFRQLGTIFVDRDNPDRVTLVQCIEAAKHGPLFIFPEGTRSKSLVLGEGKAGVGIIARRAGVPVIAVTVNGTQLPMWKLVFGWLVPAWRIRIAIGEPYRPAPGERAKEIADQIMRRIAAPLPPERRGVYG
jgi:1-acyl-sn-glycerol-3-phosphate acyltransferase